MALYYNSITKKYYNSYENAISDCKMEMEKLHDIGVNKMLKFLKSKKQRVLKTEIEYHNSETREKMRDGSVVTVSQASEYIDTELGLTLSTWHETWTKQSNWRN